MTYPFTRRAALHALGFAGLAGAFGIATERAFAAGRAPVARGLFDPSDICRVADTAPGAAPGALRKVKLTWNANSVCTIAIPIAQQKGFFARHGLEVELINFGGSTDALLEAIATGKADAGVGMALRWLKPLEQGFDVKLTGGIHGGCIRLLASKQSGITSLAGFRGKTIAVGDMAGAEKNFFSIAFGKAGIDPGREVNWRQFPPDLLSEAVKRGEADGSAFLDPLGYLIRERDNLTEIYSNLHGDFANRACCIIGIRGSLVRDERPVAAALTRALLEAGLWGYHNVAEAAAIYAPNAPGRASNAVIADILSSHAHNHQPLHAAFKQEIAAYAEELKTIQVFRPSTSAARYADRVVADVLV